MFIKFLQHYNIIDYIQQKSINCSLFTFKTRMVARRTNCAPYLMFIVVVFDSMVLFSFRFGARVRLTAKGYGRPPILLSFVGGIILATGYAGERGTKLLLYLLLTQLDFLILRGLWTTRKGVAPTAAARWTMLLREEAIYTNLHNRK